MASTSMSRSDGDSTMANRYRVTILNSIGSLAENVCISCTRGAALHRDISFDTVLLSSSLRSTRILCALFDTPNKCWFRKRGGRWATRVSAELTIKRVGSLSLKVRRDEEFRGQKIAWCWQSCAGQILLSQVFQSAATSVRIDGTFSTHVAAVSPAQLRSETSLTGCPIAEARAVAHARPGALTTISTGRGIATGGFAVARGPQDARWASRTRRNRT